MYESKSAHCTSSPIDALLSIMHLIESADQHLQGHGIRTARYAVPLGDAVGFSPTELNDLCLASLLHDVGVLTLPRHLLDKEGPLSDEEYVLLQSHPRAGAELLATIPVLYTAALWIAHHHERWDGFGYPYGLRGEYIPLGARVLAVADTFDSLTSPHSFRPALDPDCALRLLRDLAGSQLDPSLVPVFTHLIPTCSLSSRDASMEVDTYMGRLVPPAHGQGSFRSSGRPCPPHLTPRGDNP